MKQEEEFVLHIPGFLSQLRLHAVRPACYRARGFRSDVARGDRVKLVTRGAGKTTYCSGVAQVIHDPSFCCVAVDQPYICILSPRLLQMMNALGRPAIIVNLDPGNENIPYKAAVDIRELVAVPVVMEEMGLGINGALVYADMHALRLILFLASMCPVLRTHHNAPCSFTATIQHVTPPTDTAWSTSLQI
jgi:hypothetical protein